MKRLLFLAIALQAQAILFAQHDSLPKKNVLKDYGKVIPATAVTTAGLFILHQVDDQYYFEIPANILGKDLLVVTRVTQGSLPQSVLGPVLPGDELSNTVVRLERAAGNKILIRKGIFTTYAGDSTSGVYQAVQRSIIWPIIASVPIEAESPAHGLVLNFTDLILGSVELFTFTDVQRSVYYLSSLTKESSFIERVQSFPTNVEIATLKTYKKSRTQNTIPPVTVSEDASFELNTSIVLLPEEPMRPRLADQRVGYFTINELDYAGNRSGVSTRSYVERWRLEPRPADIERYKKGELVEPEKPIIFYIDPATPKQWIPYLIQGVRDWQPAFEQAGFKNAIMAKVAPTRSEDASWSLYDARHSAIVYKASDVENASGPSITDPRTGEILESHINWYHNLLQLLHDKYMMACAAVDPAARKMVFDDTLMGKLVRYAIAHEVGHTLGLQHNMGASAMVPVEKLRDKAWVEKNGICPSVMDYARFNYVAQPEDRMSENELVARLGSYDKWAIEWGYKWLTQYASAQEEKTALAQLTSKRLQDSSLLFLSQHSWDPRAQVEALGDDPIKASGYGIQNLKRMLPHLKEWNTAPGQSYEQLFTAYRLLQSQYLLYLRHVTGYIGGNFETIKYADQPGGIYRPVSRVYQQRAMRFLSDHAFVQPVWILDSSILQLTGQTGLMVMGGLNDGLISTVLSAPKIQTMKSVNESTFSNTYTVLDYLNDLKKNVWSELYSGKPIDLFRRNLQERYFKYLLGDLKNADNAALYQIVKSGIKPSEYLELFPMDAVVMQKGQLLDIQQMARQRLRTVTDQATRYHLEWIDHELEFLHGK